MSLFIGDIFRFVVIWLSHGADRVTFLVIGYVGFDPRVFGLWFFLVGSGPLFDSQVYNFGCRSFGCMFCCVYGASFVLIGLFGLIFEQSAYIYLLVFIYFCLATLQWTIYS